MKMEIALFLLAFAVLWETSSAMQCYRCVPERLMEAKHIPTCDAFDFSEPFLIDCPHSTGCIKRETQLLSLGVTTKSTERDCAHQTMAGDQEKVDGHWQPVDKIYEAYEEGCQEEANQFNKATKATQCFCRGDLCNSAVVTRGGVGIIVTIALWATLN